MHQSTTPSLSQTIWLRWASRQFVTLPIVQTLLSVTFAYSVSSEAVVMRQFRRWKRLWRRSLTRSHKRTSMGPSRSCWNGTTSALQPEEITSKGTRVSCVYYQWKCPYKKSLETYLMILVVGGLSENKWIQANPNKVKRKQVCLKFELQSPILVPTAITVSLKRGLFMCNYGACSKSIETETVSTMT